MKLIAQTPAEDKLLKEIEGKLTELGVTNVFSQTFSETFLAQHFADQLTLPDKDIAHNWTPSQRLWFYQVSKELFDSQNFKQFEGEYISLVKSMSLVFKEENKAFKAAVDDFKLFTDIQNNCRILHVDNYGKLKKYLDKGIVKGNNSSVRTASTYYDKSLSSYVVELNSIKVPYMFKDNSIKEDSVIYAWSDTDFGHSFEFLKPDIIREIENGGQKQNSAFEYMIDNAQERQKIYADNKLNISASKEKEYVKE